MISNKLFILGTIIIMAATTISTTSCASNSNTVDKSLETSTEQTVRHFPASTMQIAMAEKATKALSENNPITTQRFTADPAVLVYNDTVYVYGTNDTQQVEANFGKNDNGYDKINSLNVFSSKDLVNWTDLGVIKVAGSSGAAKWARNSWAPAICCKKIDGKDKFFLYFADSANGIGVLTADSPEGPFTDPIGSALVNRSFPNMKGVYWLFDPAVIVDDDGTGYLYFGGGVESDIEHPKSARCVQLNDDMISLAGIPQEIDAPFLFEDSGINKINGKWYYSYCSNWADRSSFKGEKVPGVASICYMTSDNPLGPFTYQGESLLNPGKYFGPWGNNHHWIFQFKNKWYIAYHTQTLEKVVGLEKGGYRCLFINDFAINEDGSWPIQSVTKTGPEQVCLFNPYEKVSASTIRYSRNMVITAEKVFPTKEDAYLMLRGVDFSKGASEITITVPENLTKGTLTVSLDKVKGGIELGTLSVNSTGTITGVLTFPADCDKSKPHDLFLSISGVWSMKDWQIK